MAILGYFCVCTKKNIFVFTSRLFTRKSMMEKFLLENDEKKQKNKKAPFF